MNSFAYKVEMDELSITKLEVTEYLLTRAFSRKAPGFIHGDVEAGVF